MHYHQPIATVVVSRPGVLRQSLLASLSAFPWITVVGSTGDGLNALSLIGRLQPTLVVIDANLLDAEVETLLSAIKARQPATGCLVVQHSGHQELLLLAAGADAIIMRDSSTHDLEQMLLKVAQLHEH